VVKWKENPLGKRGSEAGHAPEKMARADLRLGVAECGKEAQEAEKRC